MFQSELSKMLFLLYFFANICCCLSRNKNGTLPTMWTNRRTSMAYKTRIPNITLKPSSIRQTYGITKYYSTEHRAEFSNVTTPISTNTSSTLLIPTSRPSIFPLQGPLSLNIYPIGYIEGSPGNILAFTCNASGANLQRMEPYELMWYSQGLNGKLDELARGENVTTIIYKHKFTKSEKNREFFCAINFNKLTPNIYAQVKSEAVTVHVLSRSGKELDDKNLRSFISDENIYGSDGSPNNLMMMLRPNSDGSSMWVYSLIVGLVVGFVGIAAIVIAIWIIYKKNRIVSPINARPINEMYPIMPQQENEYSYVPLQVMPFYATKALAAANMKVSSETVKPPPLPVRPRHLKPESDYDVYTSVTVC